MKVNTAACLQRNAVDGVGLSSLLDFISHEPAGEEERAQKSLSQPHVQERNICNTKEEMIKAGCVLNKCGFLSVPWFCDKL